MRISDWSSDVCSSDLAGFAPDELEVQVEDNQVVIRGRQADDQNRVYLHRGIAARQFQRSFVLADGIEITGATLDAGLLNVDMVRPQVEAQTRNNEIRTPSGPAAEGREGRAHQRTGTEAR